MMPSDRCGTRELLRTLVSAALLIGWIVLGQFIEKSFGVPAVLLFVLATVAAYGAWQFISSRHGTGKAKESGDNG